MSQDPNLTPEMREVTEKRNLTILTLMFKPIEYGLIGFVIIAVLWSAQKIQVLPKTFKGFGVEIEIPQEQAEVIRESFLKIDSLEADVAKLRDELATLADNAVTFGGVSEVTAESVAEVAQDVLVTQPLTLKKQVTQTGTGYIWLGTYTKAGAWIEASIATDQNLANLPTPERLKGTKQTIEIDTNLRDSAPQNNDIYFKEAKRLGFVPVGTTLKVIAQPRSYERAGVIQIWAEVETEYKPL